MNQTPILNERLPMKLPIGNSDFREIITNGYTFVDKSLMIKDIIDDGAKVSLFTRPRRFGKTLNMQMLQHFFSAEVNGKPTKELFSALKIAQAGERYLQHQGKYPVVFLTFKDVKAASYEEAYQKLCLLIGKLYDQHSYLLSSNKLSKQEAKIYQLLVNRTASQTDVINSLVFLTEYLYRYYQEKPIVLIDEYDTPIQSSYTAQDSYYIQMIDLMRGFLGTGLKDNDFITKAVLTGILRISKESIFSDINNVESYSLLRSDYGQYFGFTEAEVGALLNQAQLSDSFEDIKHWYNGYQCGKEVLYNPWSIVNCIKQRGELQPYWVNTSDNTLIKQQLIMSRGEFKAQLTDLLKGQQVEQVIDENLVFADLELNPGALWSLLLAAGYLKVVNQKQTEQGLWCTLALPNREIRNLYRQIIEGWLANGEGILWYNKFIHSLLQGDILRFSSYLSTFFKRTVSCFDMAQEPEAFYHGLMLGLAASLDSKHYALKSNHESGYGRYDIAIIAKTPKKLSIILELKLAAVTKAAKDNEETLSALLKQQAMTALAQINALDYGAELAEQGAGLLKLGLAFYGKRFEIAFK